MSRGQSTFLDLPGDRYCEPNKFVSPSHFSDPDATAGKLVQIANASESVRDGRIYIKLLNNPFLKEGGMAERYRPAIVRAVTLR